MQGRCLEVSHCRRHRTAEASLEQEPPQRRGKPTDISLWMRSTTRTDRPTDIARLHLFQPLISPPRGHPSTVSRLHRHSMSTMFIRKTCLFKGPEMHRLFPSLNFFSRILLPVKTCLN